ncbi:DUF6677 family protein [Lacunimicrobium album]
MSLAPPTTTAPDVKANAAVKRDPKVPVVALKNPLIAGVLAYLIPGAGHFYQGRMFKAVLYFVCILSTFGFGVSIGEGRPVYMYYYNRVDDGPKQEIFMEVPADIIVQDDVQANGSRRFSQRLLNYGYLAQVMVGLPALPGYFQTSRYHPENKTEQKASLQKGYEGEFEGGLVGYRENDKEVQYPAKGRVVLKLANADVESIVGTFNGSVTIDGRDEPVVLELGHQVKLGVPVFADPRRGVIAGVTNPELLKLAMAQLQGSTPRAFKDWYGVPIEDATLQVLNQNLGKNWELSMVFTWIAGLLNILAIWDAIEGPAYGRGDEQDEDEQPAGGPEPSVA